MDRLAVFYLVGVRRDAGYKAKGLVWVGGGWGLVASPAGRPDWGYLATWLAG